MNGSIKGRIIRPEAEKSRLILPRVGQIKIGMKNAMAIIASTAAIVEKKLSGL